MVYTWPGLCFSMFTLPFFLLIISWFLKEPPQSIAEVLPEDTIASQKRKQIKALFRKVWLIAGWLELGISGILLFACYHFGRSLDYTSNLCVLIMIVEIIGALMPFIIARHKAKSSNA